MFERLGQRTRVLDLRGVLLVGALYSAIGSLPPELGLSEAMHAFLLCAVYVLSAGAFARDGGREWARGAAQHSLLAVVAGGAWDAAEGWAASVLAPLAGGEPDGMQFSIAEGPCFGPPPLEAAMVLLRVMGVVASGAIPIGWVARRLFPVDEEW